MSWNESDWKPAASYAANYLVLLLVGLFIASLFVVFLSLAMAQQQVEKNIQDLPNPPALADAFYLKDQSNELKSNIKTRETNLLNAKRGKSEAERRQAKAEGEKESARTDFQNASSEARLRTWCPEEFDQKAINTLNMPTLLEIIRKCKKSKPDRPDISQYTKRMDSAYGGWVNADIRYDQSSEKIVSFAAEIEGLENGLDDLRNDAKLASELEPKFRPLDKLQSLFKSYGFGFFGWVFDVPPSILPLFMSFASGLFGSLLINLILVVYPDNNSNVRKGIEFLQHVFLGGLIAAAVFVVIGSGTAVLGFSSAGEGVGNFLSFSALGLFSGMFSKQAAHWLDKQAKQFNADSKGDEVSNPTPTTPRT